MGRCRTTSGSAWSRSSPPACCRRTSCWAAPTGWPGRCGRCCPGPPRGPSARWRPAVVVFEPDRLDATDPLVDLAIRFGASADAAGLVLQRPEHPVPLATRRLADKLALPVVLLDRLDAAEVIATLDTHVRRPEVTGARLLDELTRRLRAARPHPDELIRILAGVLKSPVALVDGEARAVGGDAAVGAALVAGGQVEWLRRGHPAPGHAEARDGQLLLLQPLGLAQDGPANLWLVVSLPAGSPLVDAARNALGVAAWAFACYLATETLAAERASRKQALLLAEVLECAEAPTRAVVERATAAGWRLAGWHTAVHVAGVRPLAPAAVAGLGRRIEESVARHGASAGLVERSEGWALWLTTDATPEPARSAELAGALRQALLREERNGARLCAGIGRSYLGTAGLRRSLHEAVQAAALARARDVSGAVEHIDGITAKRLLTGWYDSTPLREVAANLLEPLTAADPTGELLRTLACYLDNESSTTTTAIVLGVHRNTVLHRLDRIRALLPVDLSQPDERLATRLATWSARAAGSAGPGTGG